MTVLLLDFGGRSSAMKTARQTLLAPNWAHNQQLQNLILEVTSAMISRRIGPCPRKAARGSTAAPLPETPP